MKPFDAHCHLYDTAFDADRDKIIADAKKVLSGIVVVGENPETNRKVLELCKKYPEFLFPGLAIHPDQVHLLTDEQIDEEISFIRKQKGLVCIGECGLDYLWAKKSGKYEEAKRRQQETFKKMIELAGDMDLPLNIHSRRAVSAVVEVLKELRPKRAVLHGFSGTLEDTRQAIALGYEIAISTAICYAEPFLKAAVENFPLNAFVLETDSPVLAPKKGERNEPKNISLVINEIARIKKLPESEIIEITNNNFREMFLGNF